jgi:uncharacterized protein
MIQPSQSLSVVLNRLVTYWQAGLSFCVGICLFSQLWIAPALATGVYDFPNGVDSSNWVYDEAEILSRTTEGKLNDILSSLAEDSNVEIRFVTVHRLDYGETIDSFADQLLQRWFKTPGEQTNQVLLVLDNVTNTSTIRYGQDVSLAQDIAESIAQETLQAPIRKGNRYNQAFLDASDRLIAVLSGQPDPGAPVLEEVVQTEGTFATPEETKSSNAVAWVIGLLVAATVIPMATYYLYQIIQS